MCGIFMCGVWVGIHVWVVDGRCCTCVYLADTFSVAAPQDIDPSLVSWKGASILACLDSCQELWIRQPEYRQASVRLLRERTPFEW